MAVEIYQGTQSIAEDANNYIDSQGIISCCNSLKDISEELINLSRKFYEVAQYCNKDKLSVRGKEFQSVIENCGDKIDNAHNYIQNYIEEILKATQRAIDKKQIELNDIAKMNEM